MVLLDSTVAEIYGVEVKRINEAVKNNPEKFPAGYVIELEKTDWDLLKSKFSTSIKDSFEISVQAVKKQTRIFKSVLKLDKNFHIYIHGNNELIEHGIEKDGRKFYKIYFENES